MGYDISYHPVDGKFTRERVIPYVRGSGSLDDVIPDMVRLRRVRDRAAAWALQVFELQSQERKARRAAEQQQKEPPPPSELGGFDADLHVWGRPFFITAPTPGEVSEVIDRYCAARTDAQVDALARRELARLNPALRERVKAPARARHSDEKIARGLVANLDRTRTFLELARRGQPYVDEEGEEYDAREAFAHNFPLAAVAFVAVLRPGWMARGLVWPTLMLDGAGHDPAEYFEKPTPLFAPLLRSNPAIAEALEPTIVCNYVLGGYVRPGRVRGLRRFLRESREQIVAALDYGEEELRKIDEALYDAQRRKLGFVEAAEIYSGIMGILN